jgi:hypothetical protein
MRMIKMGRRGRDAECDVVFGLCLDAVRVLDAYAYAFGGCGVCGEAS